MLKELISQWGGWWESGCHIIRPFKSSVPSHTSSRAERASYQSPASPLHYQKARISGSSAQGYSQRAQTNGEQVGAAPTIQPSSDSNPPAPHSSPASAETLKDGCSRPMAVHILIFNKYCSGLKFKAGNMYQQMKVLMSTFSFLTAFLSSLSSPTCLLMLSSFKGFTLSAIPSAHTEAN